MNKTCCVCKTLKLLDEFSLNKSKKDGRNSICKLCTKEYNNKYYDSNTNDNKTKRRKKQIKRVEIAKACIKQLKAIIGCVFCDEKESCCLDFHHLEAKDKSFMISDAVKCGYNWSLVETELKKCVALCANCHRKLHNGVLSLKLTANDIEFFHEAIDAIKYGS